MMRMRCAAHGASVAPEPDRVYCPRELAVRVRSLHARLCELSHCRLSEPRFQQREFSPIRLFRPKRLVEFLCRGGTAQPRQQPLTTSSSARLSAPVLGSSGIPQSLVSSKYSSGGANSLSKHSGGSSSFRSPSSSHASRAARASSHLDSWLFIGLCRLAPGVVPCVVALPPPLLSRSAALVLAVGRYFSFVRLLPSSSGYGASLRRPSSFPLRFGRPSGFPVPARRRPGPLRNVAGSLRCRAPRASLQASGGETVPRPLLADRFRHKRPFATVCRDADALVQRVAERCSCLSAERGRVIRALRHQARQLAGCARRPPDAGVIPTGR